MLLIFTLITCHCRKLFSVPRHPLTSTIFHLICFSTAWAIWMSPPWAPSRKHVDWPTNCSKTTPRHCHADSWKILLLWRIELRYAIVAFLLKDVGFRNLFILFIGNWCYAKFFKHDEGSFEAFFYHAYRGCQETDRYINYHRYTIVRSGLNGDDKTVFVSNRGKAGYYTFFSFWPVHSNW